jgi:PPOX class probable F420-dependent enzyme
LDTTWKCSCNPRLGLQRCPLGGARALDLTEHDAKGLLASASVARLATITEAGRPHIVPVTFAVDGNRIYTAVDAKPKTTMDLRRLRNIRRDPRVAVLADHYEADWDRLWWARAEGLASILGEPGDRARPLELLAARYPQYRARPPAGPVIAIAVERWTGWSASDTP